MSTSNHKWATLPDPTPADLARAVAGDVDAFKTIVERYQGMVYSVAYNVLGNHTDAEDAAQEAFLRCYRKLPQYRSEATFSTWLFRLALTASVDYQRRERRRPVPVEVPELAAGEQAELGDGITAATLTAALARPPRRLPRAHRAARHLRPAVPGDRRHHGAAARHRQGHGPPRARVAAPASAGRTGVLMDCSYFRARLNQYVDGELGYLEVAELQSHLSFCPRLRRRARAAERAARRAGHVGRGRAGFAARLRGARCRSCRP